MREPRLFWGTPKSLFFFGLYTYGFCEPQVVKCPLFLILRSNQQRELVKCLLFLTFWSNQQRELVKCPLFLTFWSNKQQGEAHT